MLIGQDFPFVLGEPGASNNKCSETYHGPSAFSEPESKHVSDYITRLGKMVRVYVVL